MTALGSADLGFQRGQNSGACILEKKSKNFFTQHYGFYYTPGKMDVWELRDCRQQSTPKMVPERFRNGAGGTLKSPLRFWLPGKASLPPGTQTRALGVAAPPAELGVCLCCGGTAICRGSDTKIKGKRRENGAGNAWRERE